MIMKENKIRNKQVNVRLTEAEYRRLDEAAQASGIREIGLSSDGTVRLVAP